MKTEDLIATLAADTLPRASVGARVARWLVPALVLAAAAVAIFWGLRGDLGAALMSGKAIKTLVPLALGGLALAAVLRQSSPGRPEGRVALAAGVLGGLTALLFLAIWLRAPEGAFIAAVRNSSLEVCLLSIPVLAVVPLVAMLWGLKSGASLNPARSGMFAGLAAGGLAAALYSAHCTDDSPLFFLPAYAAGICIVALAGRIAGARLLRW